MSITGREITHLSMHSTYYAPGLGNVPTTLTTIGDRTFRSITSMVKTETGVLVKCIKDGKNVDFHIPDSNCQGQTLKAE